MKKNRLFAVIPAVIALLLILSGCESSERQKYFSLDDLKGSDKVFSLWQGSGYEDYLVEAFPEASMEYGEYVADLGMKVLQGKSDAMLIGESFFNFFHDELTDMVVLDGDLGTIQGALIFSSSSFGNALRLQFNQFLADAYADGTIDELTEKWLKINSSERTVDLNALDPSWDHIRVGVASDEPPYAYMSNKKLAGYDAELIVRFCREYQYYPDYSYANYEDLITSVQMDRFDVIGAGFEIVDDRSENVSYGDPSREDRVIVAVKGEKQKTDFIESVKKSFRRTFIDEDRYMDFVGGIGTTMLMVISSVGIGFILGFLLYILSRDGGKIANGFLTVLSTIVHRVPSVVLLMILYYVVFGSVNISTVLVSIIFFTIFFAVSTLESIQLAIDAIGKGQKEASFSLGLTNNETLFKILLPQGRNVFMFGIKDSIVSIMLESSVVGYIAAVDLTRVGDIIRNNTYEAFFPLIAVAIFYFLLSSLVIGVVSYFEKKTDPKNRSEKAILKSIAGQVKKQ